MLDQLEEVDGGVEEGWVEFLFEIWIVFSGFETSDVAGDVDQRDNVDGELPKNTADDVDVENIRLRSLLGELFDRLLKESLALILLLCFLIVNLPLPCSNSRNKHSSKSH